MECSDVNPGTVQKGRTALMSTPGHYLRNGYSYELQILYAHSIGSIDTKVN